MKIQCMYCNGAFKDPSIRSKATCVSHKMVQYLIGPYMKVICEYAMRKCTWTIRSNSIRLSYSFDLTLDLYYQTFNQIMRQVTRSSRHQLMRLLALSN